LNNSGALIWRMMKRLIGNCLATFLAAAVGIATLWVSMHFLKQPEGFLDWTVVILSGITTGTLAFFVTWGHFQDDPVVASRSGTDSSQ
jgi:hypothetical protein